MSHRPPFIHPHEHLGNLVQGLVDDLRSAQADGAAGCVPRPVPVVVPSIQFADWLQIAIARRMGCCMGLKFLKPQEFISRVQELSGIAGTHLDNPWSKCNTTWLLLPEMEQVAHRLGLDESSTRERFALAALLADQFDQYGHYRPEIIRAWSNDKPFAAKKWSADERQSEEWQRELWLKLKAAITKDTQTPPHPALLLDKLAADEENQRLLRREFPRIHALGTGSLDPLMVRALSLLNVAGCDVRVRLVLPSLGYLGELPRRRPALTDPEQIEMRDGHPLLVSMGRHAVGAFQLLGELDEQYTGWPAHGSGETEAQPTSLLGSIQADIRHVRMPQPSDQWTREDISLRVHSCHGARREMEVLRDELLRAFRDIENLNPEEVVVATPSLKTYAPLVAAVLGQEPALPIRLTELPPSEQGPVPEGLLALLAMTGGSFEASSLLGLLQLRSVRACLGILDDAGAVERLRDWVMQSGLTRGLGEDADSPDADTGTWRFARDRIIAGKWLGPESAAPYPDGEFALPTAAQLGSDTALKQTFIEWHHALSRTLREWTEEAKPAEWSARFSKACATLLADPVDEDALLEVQPALNFLAHLECEQSVDAASMQDWLQGELAEFGGRTKVSGKITFGQLMQVQNIPCRVLALVGMQDGAFPRQKRVPAWDLLHLDPRPWDRNARVDDRQLFLDAVLTPSERLIITAGSRNVHTGKSEPFSACVDELLRTAQEMGAPRNILVVEHRLQPFSPGYFAEGNGEDDLPRSFDARSARIANSFSTRPTGTETAPPFWTPDNIRKEIVSCGKSKEISVEQLIGFWKDPARALLRAAGVTLPFDEESDQALDRAPVEMNSLQQWNVKQAILQEMLSGRNSLECTRALLQAGRSLPPAAMGKLRWDALRTQVEPLGNGLLQSRREPLLVEHELEAGGAVLVLTGTIPRAEAAGENFLLACRAGTFKTAKDYLDPWIRSIVAAAEGCTHRTLVMDEKNTGPMLQFKAHEQAGAREQLQFLLAGFLEGQERPLCYAPLTSEVYAQKCQAWDATDLDALTAASSAWNKEGFDNQPSGEGWSAAASIVWRNQNPFALAAQWHQWAHDIARPLLAWRDPGKAEDR